MAIDQELGFASTVELSDRLRRRDISAVELLEGSLDRIGALEPRINAFVEVFAESARAAASESDRRLAGGGEVRALEGIPIPIKDLTMISGSRLGFGSRLSPPFEMPQDAEFVSRLRGAGAVIIGRTTLPEFGSVPSTECVVTGATHNPWDLSYSPGGSSGGAAAAVASGMVPAAHGTDGGGSLRIPASACGLFTLKTTRGLVSPDPLEDDFAFTVAGFLTRTVADNARLLDLVSGSIVGDAYYTPAPAESFSSAIGSKPRRLRVALATSAPTGVEVHPACVAAARATADLLSDLGHDVVEAAPAWSEGALAEDFIKAWSMVVGTGIEQLSLLGGGSAEDVEPHNRALHAAARGLDALQVGLAIAQGRGYSRRVLSFYRDHDVLVTPTLAETPWKLGEFFSRVDADPLSPFVRAEPTCAFTALCNLTGQPAVSVPLGEHQGMPVGVQIAGRLGDDGLLLQLAAEIEAARAWSSRRPSIGAE